MRHTACRRKFEGHEPRAQRFRRGSAHTAVCADDAMGGNEEIEGRRGHCRSHRAMGVRPSDSSGDVGIRDELREVESRDRAPCFDAQRRSLEAQRQIEASQSAREVGDDLCECFGEQRFAGRLRASAASRHELAGKNFAAVAYHHQIGADCRANSAARRCPRHRRAIKTRTIHLWRFREASVRPTPAFTFHLGDGSSSP